MRFRFLQKLHFDSPWRRWRMERCSGGLHPMVPYISALVGALIHWQRGMESSKGRRKLHWQTSRHSGLEIRLFFRHFTKKSHDQTHSCTFIKTRREYQKKSEQTGNQTMFTNSNQKINATLRSSNNVLDELINVELLME